MKTRMIQKQFKRRESKYIVDKGILALLEHEFATHLEADRYAQSTITTIYFDNHQFDMIQDSLAKKHHREKVRMRLYDAIPQQSSQAFLEIKKKVEGVGYKYRVISTPQAVTNYIERGVADTSIHDNQITSSLHQLRQRYGKLQPMMYIYYNRRSFRGKEDAQLRITIDQDLCYRDEEVSALKGTYGNPLLDNNLVIMEIKTIGEMPVWLISLLEIYQLEKRSFSKYGTAYQLSQEKGGVALASHII